MIESFLKEHGEYYADRSFRQLTTLKIGGGIRHFVAPRSFEDVQKVIAFLKENHVPFKVLGNGSNMICGETFFEGAVVSLKNMNSFEISGSEVYVEAGVLAPYLANVFAKEGLTGFEFASSIPGNIGGLVYMNAGAYKKEMKDVVKEILVLKNDEMVWMSKEDAEFSYRTSIFQSHPHWVVLACRMELEKGSSEEIFALMADRLERRKATQPLDMPSPGSCFRNPEGQFAWKYIDEMGYRGYKLGDIQVSEKHSNFIVNTGNGTADDFLNLVYMIQRDAKEKYGLKLIMEVEKFNC